MIFGSAGSGKTTLGRMVAQKLGVLFVDIDEYIWQRDVDVPYSVMYPKEEKISRLMSAISEADRFVMAGSMDSFHEWFDPFFVLAVHLTAPAQLRVARVHRREYEEFGERILIGGDMYAQHQRFLCDVAAYDTGGGSTSLAVHTKWADSLQCPVLRLDGSEELSTNVNTIIDTFAGSCTI